MTTPQGPGPESTWSRLEHQDRDKAKQGRRLGWFLLPGVLLVNTPTFLAQVVGVELPLVAVVGFLVFGMACLVMVGVLLWSARRSSR